MRKKRQIIPKTSFSTNIKTIWEASKAGNIMLCDLAKTLGISERQIQLWKKNKSVPGIPSAIRIARHFNLTLDELFFSKISPDRISGRRTKRK